MKLLCSCCARGDTPRLQLWEFSNITQTNLFSMNFTVSCIASSEISKNCYKYAKKYKSWYFQTDLLRDKSEVVYRCCWRGCVMSATAGTWPNHPNQSIHYGFHCIIHALIEPHPTIKILRKERWGKYNMYITLCVISATAGTWPNHPNQSIFDEIHFTYSCMYIVYIISACMECLINIYLKIS